MNGGVVHIAGLVVDVVPFMRQRCAWCGAVLLDYDLSRLAVACPDHVDDEGDFRPASWPVGGLVEVDGNCSTSVPHDDSSPVPANCCARLDPAATR